jgi:hypothetical protein
MSEYVDKLEKALTDARHGSRQSADNFILLSRLMGLIPSAKQQCDKCGRLIEPEMGYLIHANQMPFSLRDNRLGHYFVCKGGC